MLIKEMYVMCSGFRPIAVEMRLFPEPLYITCLSWHFVQEMGSAIALLPVDFHMVALGTCLILYYPHFTLMPS